MRIGIIGAGHAFKNQYKALEYLGYQVCICDCDKNKIKNYPEDLYFDYHDLVNKIDIAYVSTPPSTHFEIIKFFLENNIFVISEKPLVTNIHELDILDNLINNNFYNMLHFSFGDEIEWFMSSNYKYLIPYKICAYINDPYISNKHIREESLSLNGSYLDETINPLSAIARIYGYDIKFINANLKNYEGDIFDYHSESKFLVSNIDTNIYVDWNDTGSKEKYIDLYFKNFIIRLDSFNSRVINLTTKEVLYKSNEERMFKHYINGFKDFLNNKTNKEISLKLNREILKYKL